MNLQLLIDSTPALIHSGLPDGYIDFFNRQWLNFVGLPFENILGWKWTSTIHPEDVEAFVEKRRATLETGELFEGEARVRRADGEYRWMLHRSVPLRDGQGKIVRWYGSSIDIEDRKRMESDLQRSEAYLAEAQRLSHIGSFVYSPGKRKTLYWSEELFRIFALDPRHGGPDYDETRRLVYPDDCDRVSESCLQGFREKADFTQDFRVLLRDGSVKHLYVIWHPVLDKAGEVVEYFGTAMDVTERKHAEEALRRSEEELRDVIETVPAMVWSAMPDGSNVLMNKRWADYTGLSATGLGWQAAVHPEDLGRHLDVFYESSAQGVPFQDEVRFSRADGEYRWFIVAGVPLRDEKGNVLKWYGLSGPLCQDNKGSRLRW